MPSKYDAYEIESLLFDVKEKGHVFINKYKLWRLLGKGSGAAGTWKSLLDTWQEIDKDHKRTQLYGFEAGNDYFISTHKTTSLEIWAGER